MVRPHGENHPHNWSISWCPSLNETSLPTCYFLQHPLQGPHDDDDNNIYNNNDDKENNNDENYRAKCIAQV